MLVLSAAAGAAMNAARKATVSVRCMASILCETARPRTIIRAARDGRDGGKVRPQRSDSRRRFRFGPRRRASIHPTPHGMRDGIEVPHQHTEFAWRERLVGIAPRIGRI